MVGLCFFDERIRQKHLDDGHGVFLVFLFLLVFFVGEISSSYPKNVVWLCFSSFGCVFLFYRKKTSSSSILSENKKQGF